MVVETMKKEHLSIYAAMQEFGINDHKIIERWERIYRSVALSSTAILIITRRGAPTNTQDRRKRRRLRMMKR